MIKHTLLRYSLLCAGLAFAGAVAAQELQVKSMEYKMFEQLPDAEEGMDLDLVKKELKRFNKAGQMIRQEVHLANPIGKLTRNKIVISEWLEDLKTDQVIKFDEMGDSLTSVKTFVSKKGKLKVKEEIIDLLNSPDKMLTKAYEYTEFAKPLKVTFTDKAGEKIGEETYKYNSDDEEILYKKWELLPDGNKKTESKKTNYTKDGYLESSEKITKDGKDTYRDVIIFDGTKIKEQTKFKNGEEISNFGGGGGSGGAQPGARRVLMTFGDADEDDGGFGSFGGGFGGMLPEVEEEFDDKGNKIKVTETEGIELVKTITYKYDDKSNLLEVNETKYEEGEEDGTKKEEYAYDKGDNMTKKAIYKNGKKTKEELFKYVYFGDKEAAASEENDAPSGDKKEAKKSADKTDSKDASGDSSKAEDAKSSQLKIVDK
jgi:hypothetical protein